MKDYKKLGYEVFIPIIDLEDKKTIDLFKNFSESDEEIQNKMSKEFINLMDIYTYLILPITSDVFGKVYIGIPDERSKEDSIINTNGMLIYKLIYLLGLAHENLGGVNILTDEGILGMTPAVSKRMKELKTDFKILGTINLETLEENKGAFNKFCLELPSNGKGDFLYKKNYIDSINQLFEKFYDTPEENGIDFEKELCKNLESVYKSGEKLLKTVGDFYYNHYKINLETLNKLNLSNEEELDDSILFSLLSSPKIIQEYQISENKKEFKINKIKNLKISLTLSDFIFNTILNGLKVCFFKYSRIYEYLRELKSVYEKIDKIYFSEDEHIPGYITKEEMFDFEEEKKKRENKKEENDNDSDNIERI